ncbi:MAG TPA: DNA-binding transcriptional regulator, partial [Candidatus Baltobacteraceae bacterium]|nr:DNA-binding transcriptional regulator [Candidatus Baltobacteraceae bacterium]
MSKNSNPKQVALLIESSRAYGRNLLVGIAKYIRDHEPWIVSRREHKLEDEIPQWFREWKGDGVITRLDNPKLPALLKKMNVPVVYLRTPWKNVKAPSVLLDDRAVVRMAFEHLRERGFRHFAFCGLNGADYSDVRRTMFVELVRNAGFRCHVFKSARRMHFDTVVGYERHGLLQETEEVRRWIKTLPRPVGVMACNDLRGEKVLLACRAAGIIVPDEVAVIGVDNDELLCDFSQPPLSSVVPNTRRIGYEAAALLDRMMAGKPVPPEVNYVEPLGVVTRRSTEVSAVEDRQVAVAARFIREHACEGVTVQQAAKMAGLSDRTMERRFAKILGHGPKEEILRVRLNRAKQLLAETDLSLASIGEKIGLEHTEYLSRIFKRKIGMTPGQFRARAQTAV